MARTISVSRRQVMCSAAAIAMSRVVSAVEVNDAALVNPKPIDDVLTNPGIGFECGLQADRAIKNYPSCSIAYFRFYWDKLEPEEGQYNFALIDDILKRARELGRDLALRFMPMDTSPKAPAWYRAKDKGFTFKVKAAGWEKGLKKGDLVETWAPDFNSAIFLEKQEALVESFGKRYNGHPDIIRMDIGSIGRWGEWHTSGTPVPMPTEANALRVIDWYFKYWSRTPLSALIGYTPGVKHAVKKGAGWRADSLGDWGHFSPTWNHMTNAYPRQVAAGDAQEAWKRGPVTFEAPGSMQELENYVPDKGGGYDAMWKQALEWGASSFNAKSQPIPDAQVAPQERFLKRCGYRLVLRSLRHAKTARAGEALHVQMQWENVGVAPPYTPYVLAIRLTRGGKSVILDTDARLKTWLPGKHEVDAKLQLPKDLPAGEHTLEVGVLDPHYRTPEIKLAIAGRGPEGWYALSGVNVG